MANYTANYDLVKPTMAETADIRTINGNMDTIDDIMHASQVSLAPAYDQNETYNTGDIVMYEFLMYECLDDDVTGTWDSTKWQRTTASKHGGGGGGSNVSITPTLQSGTKIADFEIDGEPGELYAPSGGGGGGGGNVNGKADLIYRAVDTSFVDIAFDISKYDLYIINASDSLSQSGETYTVTRESLKYYLDNSISFCGWPYRSSSTNALIQYIVTANGFEADDHTLGFVITSIYGINTGAILAPMIYSTEEREVGAWVDDKPLYQKTIIANYTSGVGAGEHVVEHIANVEVVNGYGSYIEGTGYGYTIPYAQGTGTSLYYYDGDMIFSVGSSVSFSSGTLYLTVQYTKDSDVAGSGSYGSLGVPMEHYDDTEQVVGTYFGDTLYQKTIPNISITGTTTTIQTGVNIGSLVAIEANGYKIDGGGNIIRFKESYNDGGDRLDVEGINNNIRVICSSWFNGSTIDITIKYTKSTT